MLRIFKAEGLTPPTFSVEQGGVTVHIPREKFVAINLGGTTDINHFKGDQKTDQKKCPRKCVVSVPTKAAIGR